MTRATRQQMLRAGDRIREACGDDYLITASQMQICGSSRKTGVVQWWVYSDTDGSADLDHIDAAATARNILREVIAEDSKGENDDS